ncbi:MAG: transglutaminase domain-containing protein [Alphaproteobacteria bacterium]
MKFAVEATRGTTNDIERSVRLFYKVRDGIRYDPYRVGLSRESYKASHVLSVGSGFCLPKTNLLAACVRAVGIPAAIGLADVKNHLCTEKLRRAMGGKEIFLHHGYALLFVEGRWVKAASAFNIELCEKFGVLPTDFDGRSDALLQPIDAQGKRHMEYVVDHGIFADFPFERVIGDFKAYYPEGLFYRGDDAVRFEDEQPLLKLSK